MYGKVLSAVVVAVLVGAGCSSGEPATAQSVVQEKPAPVGGTGGSQVAPQEKPGVQPGIETQTQCLMSTECKQGEMGAPGAPGKDGRDGTNGKDGIGTPGAPGKNGVDGKNGTNGTNGKDGAGAISGSRLTAVTVDASDGSKVMVGWYDTVQKTYCKWVRIQAKVFCLPQTEVVKSSDAFFGDSLCKNPLAYIPRTTEAPTSTEAGMGANIMPDDIGTPEDYKWAIGDSNVPTAFPVVSVLKVKVHTTEIYSKNYGGGCANITPQIGQPGHPLHNHVFFDVMEKLATSAFVSRDLAVR